MSVLGRMFPCVGKENLKKVAWVYDVEYLLIFGHTEICGHLWGALRLY